MLHQGREYCFWKNEVFNSVVYHRHIKELKDWKDTVLPGERRSKWSVFIYLIVSVKERGSSKFKCWWTGEKRGSNLWCKEEKDKILSSLFSVFYFLSLLQCLHQIPFIFLKDFQCASFIFIDRNPIHFQFIENKIKLRANFTLLSFS